MDHPEDQLQLGQSLHRRQGPTKVGGGVSSNEEMMGSSQREHLDWSWKEGSFIRRASDS